MRDYARIAPEFWTGRTGRRIRTLGADVQVVALYLLTSPHASAIGLYQLPLSYLVADTGLTSEGASKALRSLSDVGFAYHDDDSESVWVPEMARFQIGEALKGGDKRVGWVEDEAIRQRKSPYFRAFVMKYREAFHLRIDLPCEPESRPIEAPSEPHRSQEQEQEQEREQEQEQAHSLACAREAPPAPAPEPPVGRFAVLAEALRTGYVARFERACPGKPIPMPARGPGAPVFAELCRVVGDLPTAEALLDAAFADSFVRGAGFTPGAIRGAADRLLAVGPKVDQPARASPKFGGMTPLEPDSAFQRTTDEELDRMFGPEVSG